MLTQTYVKKRDGRKTLFDPAKISRAISMAAGRRMKKQEIEEVATAAIESLPKKKTVNIETIQDHVETALMDRGFFHVAKDYIIYRKRREDQRNASLALMKEYNSLLFSDPKDMDLKRDNANINADSSMGIMLKLGTEGAKTYATNFALPERFADAHKEKRVHFHKRIVA